MVLEPVVKLSTVTRRFGEVTAVDELSFEVGRGETVALLGLNGAGKTTALELILGLQRPEVGAISVLGRSPGGAVASGGVGAMLQRGGLPEGARVAELVELVRGMYRRPLRLDESLALAGLERLARRRVDRLSAGQQQRVRLALALAGRPDLLLLDEPTAAMDAATRRSFWSRIAESAAERRGLLFATHRLEEAEEVADRVLMISAGRLVADGSASEVKRAAGGIAAVSFRAPGASLEVLERLPAVESVVIAGGRVSMRSGDLDRTVRALLASGTWVEDLEVESPRLEDALVKLSGEPEARE
ncbi:MAG: ATP-binding cassette domain-containing protein [Solirubrobacterales bacterium]|nr:ATP-binding cassette domain-containing protein [Solirubrobacterales bacterium]